MYDDDTDALAAEYVLGTLSAEERGHAEALLLIDSGFVDIVRQWERRLGELNVMVDAVEPPAEIWDKIKSEVRSITASEESRLAPLAPAEPAAPGETEGKTGGEAGGGTTGEDSPLLAALASRLAEPENESQAKPPSQTEAKTETKPSGDAAPRPAVPQTPKIERNTDVFYLARRERRWRSIALVSGLAAVVLAILVALSQIAPELLPAGGWHVPRLFTLSPAPATQNSQLVAVLQQEPTPPAFLLTVEPASRSMTLRRLVAAAGPAHVYELWLVLPSDAKPRSLGIVGAEDFTRRPLPPDFDLETAGNALYEISFERAGGSTSGAPTGPILFRGKLVEAVPAGPAKP